MPELIRRREPGLSVGGALRAIRRAALHNAPVSADQRRLGAVSPLRLAAHSECLSGRVQPARDMRRFDRQELLLGGDPTMAFDAPFAADRTDAIAPVDAGWAAFAAAGSAGFSPAARVTDIEPVDAFPSPPQFEPGLPAAEVIRRLEAYTAAREGRPVASQTPAASTQQTQPHGQPAEGVIRRRLSSAEPASRARDPIAEVEGHPGPPAVRSIARNVARIRRASRIEEQTPQTAPMRLDAAAAALRQLDMTEAPEPAPDHAGSHGTHDDDAGEMQAPRAQPDGMPDTSAPRTSAAPAFDQLIHRTPAERAVAKPDDAAVTTSERPGFDLPDTPMTSRTRSEPSAPPQPSVWPPLAPEAAASSPLEVTPAAPVLHETVRVSPAMPAPAASPQPARSHPAQALPVIKGGEMTVIRRSPMLGAAQPPGGGIDDRVDDALTAGAGPLVAPAIPQPVNLSELPAAGPFTPIASGLLPSRDGLDVAAMSFLPELPFAASATAARGLQSASAALTAPPLPLAKLEAAAAHGDALRGDVEASVQSAASRALTVTRSAGARTARALQNTAAAVSAAPSIIEQTVRDALPAAGRIADAAATVGTATERAVNSDSAPPQPAAAPLDLEALAQAMLPRVKRLLAIERERIMGR